MRLITLHKILIASFAAFAIFFGIRELVRSDSPSSPVVAIGSLILAIAGIIYFIWVLRGGYNRKKS